MSSLLNDPVVIAEIERIKASPDLEEPPSLVMPSLDYSLTRLSVLENVRKVQAFIAAFQYNFTGKPFVKMFKSKGAVHIFNVSKQLIKESLPIQCVEAVFLGTHLTSSMSDMDRVPLSFKTKFFHGTVHRHIVLAIRYEGKWGAIGISRRANLMNKPMTFSSLSALVEDYRHSYEECYHVLLTVYVGLPMPHNNYVDQPIKWRATKVRVFANADEDVASKINKFTSNMHKMNAHFIREGQLPAAYNKKNI